MPIECSVYIFFFFYVSKQRHEVFFACASFRLNVGENISMGFRCMAANTNPIGSLSLFMVDNAAIHKAPEMKTWLQDSGVDVVFLLQS